MCIADTKGAIKGNSKAGPILYLKVHDAVQRHHKIFCLPYVQDPFFPLFFMCISEHVFTKLCVRYGTLVSFLTTEFHFFHSLVRAYNFQEVMSR